MRVFSLRTLREFWEEYPDTELALRAWYHEAKRADWKTSADVTEAYRTADVIGNNRVVFNVKHIDYRLVVSIHYDRGNLFIRFIGTHKQYDKIDAEKV